jgi:hypothetical protein
MTEETKPKMLYSLENLGGGTKAVLDRKKVPCYYIVTDDVEGAKAAGWKTFKEVIEAYENPAPVDKEPDPQEPDPQNPTHKKRGRPPKVQQ